MPVANPLTTLLETLDQRPSPAAYFLAARQLAAHRDALQPLRIALLSSFTIDAVKPYLQVESARCGLWTDVHIAKFNTARQELLDPDGECLAFKPDVVFVAELLADVCPQLVADVSAHSQSELDDLIADTLAGLVSALSAFRRESRAAVIVHNFAPPRYPALGVYDGMAEVSEAEVIRDLNRRLSRALPRIPGVYVLDLAKVAAEVGLRHWCDDRLWYLARTALTPDAMQALAREQATFLQALHRPPRKVLALDLDNTLWGGVLGEAGLEGIALGADYPGNAFRRFQEYVLHLSRRGAVLALLSKNNRHEVDEALRTHPGMLLRPEHFAAMRVNWDAKPKNLAEIAQELSLGTDSFVFFDDDAAECALMRQLLPEVLTVQAPKDVTQYVAALDRTGVFERLALTSEDRRRGQMYGESAARRRAAATAASLDDFLQSLEMTADIRPVDAFAFPRVVSLIEKTNQFNLTTRRHSAADLHTMLADGRHGVFSLQLADRFGDNGIVGVAIARRDPEAVVIDTLLLSCRVIGRRAETALLATVAEWARREGAAEVIGEFVPTPKNAPAAKCYPQHGFQPVSHEDGRTRWRLPLGERDVPWPTCIQPRLATA